MLNAFKLAGFFAAHAIWCVYDDEILVPILAYINNSSEKHMERLTINDDLEESVNFGKKKLESNEMDANDAVLLYEGLIPINEKKTDTIVIQIKAYFSPQSKVLLALPFSPKDSGEFKVHKPKLLQWDNCEDFNLSEMLRTFFKGVSEHEQGAKIWDEHLDESI